jgi:hypothetical protein
MLKRIILWDHERGTWQYDVFCLLIIAFIFLSPKMGARDREKPATRAALTNVKTIEFSPDTIVNSIRLPAKSADQMRNIP